MIIEVQRLKDLILIDKVLKVVHEEKEQQIKQIFVHLVGYMVWEHIKDYFATSYDYEDDLYITFMCQNKYRKDVINKIEEIFGNSYIEDFGDNYTEFRISAATILSMR